MAIKFGTSGWRAVIADEMTFANVRRVADAICQYLQSISDEASNKKIVIAHDTRFLGENFAKECASVVTANGFDVLLCREPTPTPVASWAIRSQQALGGIIVTASHNPPEYNGLKFSTRDGAPALPEITGKIEAFLSESEADKNKDSDADKAKASFKEKVNNKENNRDNGALEDFNPRKAYLDDLTSKINFKAIVQAGSSYIYDPLWGTGRGYLDGILLKHGLQTKVLHDWRDPLFGGTAPDPTLANRLDELRQEVVGSGAVLGLATDGDADRFGVIDQGGREISANELIPLLCDYLAESRGWQDGFARSVATTHLVDRVGALRRLPVYETPVGFKYIGSLIDENKIILGGEESAGLSIKGHLPEKDGILACLLAIEAVAVRGMSLTEQLEDLYKRVGKLESGRIGVSLTPALHGALAEKLKREHQQIGNFKIKSINRLDGVKFILENDSWLLLRPSGTEPVVRVYAEAETAPMVRILLAEGRRYLLS